MAVANPTLKNVTYQDANGGTITRQVAEASGTVAAVSDAPTLVPNSELDVGGLDVFGFTFVPTVFGVTITVYGANDPAFSDQVVIATGNLTAGTNYLWSGGTGFSLSSVATFPYRYVRVYADNTANGSVATLAWRFFGKNS